MDFRERILRMAIEAEAADKGSLADMLYSVAASIDPNGFNRQLPDCYGLGFSQYAAGIALALKMTELVEA